MEQIKNSDEYSATMLAMNAFDHIINEIQTSNLNFQMQISPFSAMISLKKSLIKAKSGALHSTSFKTPTQRIPSSEAVIADLVAKNIQLEKDLACAIANDNDNRLKVKSLEEELFSKRETEDKMRLKSQDCEFLNLKIENEKYREKIKKQEEKIIHNENMVKTKSKIIKKLNEEMNEAKTKNEKENAIAKKMHKDEVKSWKKKLGNERKSKIKLKKIIDETENKKCGNELEKQLAEKDSEINELTKEKIELEDKMNSLLDVLYGCCECGRHGDFCECDATAGENADTNCQDDTQPDLSSLQQASPSPPPTVTPVYLPPPTSISPPPWTPPATPPCSSCGGYNYGPCPTSVCYACIPPTQPSTSSGSMSPSRTPPGTPPPFRGSHQSAPTSSSSNQLWQH